MQQCHMAQYHIHNHNDGTIHKEPITRELDWSTAAQHNYRVFEMETITILEALLKWEDKLLGVTVSYAHSRCDR
jgi:hypothetical protein